MHVVRRKSTVSGVLFPALFFFPGPPHRAPISRSPGRTQIRQDPQICDYAVLVLLRDPLGQAVFDGTRVTQSASDRGGGITDSGEKQDESGGRLLFAKDVISEQA
jgi:hypothetical protein